MNPNAYLQNTIAKEVRCSGVSLHSGKTVQMKIKPAPPNHGVKFVRTDLPSRPSIAARFNKVVDTSLATVIGEDGFIVSTIEHLMAALAALGIDNVSVEIDDYELPLMDGSAGPFVRLLKSAGLERQSALRQVFVVQEPVELQVGEKFVGVYPAPHFRITFTIEYNNCPLIGTQVIDRVITPEIFEQDIADARTFGFVQEVEYMKMYGLAKGASLDNVVVIDQDKILNESGLRFADEFVRHKLLDSVGDFSLIGLPIQGHVVAKRSGHAFNHAFLEAFFKRKGAWQTRTFEESDALWAEESLKQLAN
ncbi:MAG: UDP-3-O-acyl-N-acetylglucosamine deacetylase [Desulfobacteraceae bacterium]|nr:UDP-3-O-acyl-N-acetylglucosamine deacetylase [Desulfobacteraceae bacterium]